MDYLEMYLRFAWRYFKAKKSANAINIIAWVTVGVIAFATACQILVLSVFNGFEDLVKSLYASFYTDLKVVPSKGKTFTITPEQLTSVKKQQGIEAVSLIAEEKALLKNDDGQTAVYLKGVDNNFLKVSGVPGKIVQGKFNIGTIDDPGLIVGYGVQNAAFINTEGAFPASKPVVILAKKGNAAFSDPLQALSEGVTTATGVFAIQQDFDSKYAITNIDFVKQQMAFEKDEYSALEIKSLNGVNPKLIQQNLSKLLGANYKVQTKYEQNTSLYTTLRLEKWFIYALLTLILLIAAFNMLSALTMLVLEKQKDINILQSMGADKKMIYKIFLSEGLLLGIIGAATGIVLAVIICALQMKYKLISLQGSSFLIDYFPVKLQITDFALVTLTVLFITFLASFLPARKAANQAIELR
ncbi:FtsX-like permease family protein [Ferruginibacter sp. SUN002]|uniref:FtsX-like permease family protein n=1 Tax=Ferruginibacter sp. SUN002 TaxID=2937789 RepID=UPI003D35DCE7